VLTLYQSVPLGEAWIVGGFVSSLAAHLLLIGAAREPSVPSRYRTALMMTFGAALAFMVFRPTWWSLLP
jgi:hypothetical protein